LSSPSSIPDTAADRAGTRRFDRRIGALMPRFVREIAGRQQGRSNGSLLEPSDQNSCTIVRMSSAKQEL
jgi:hypothetical protein